LLRLPCAEQLEERNVGIGLARRHGTVLSAHVSQMTAWTSDKELIDLGLGDCLEEIGYWERVSVPGSDLASSMLYDVEVYLPGDILTKIDRASMAHGLELRAPFLDGALTAFCLALPTQLRVATHEDKRVLRAAFAPQWPNEIRSRPKRGFGAPVARWLRTREIAPLLESAVMSRSSAMYGFLPYQATQRAFGRAPAIHQWGIFALALWAQEWLT
jgi:asparagine synthase (glutamine-hydrolysing)